MNFDEYIREANQTISKGWVIAALTDEYIVDEWPLNGNGLTSKEDKILEIRIFNKDEEIKLSRSDIGKGFTFRRINDLEDHRDKYDELQYLDIDEKIGKDEHGLVTATGGGKYRLPLKSIKDAKIRIRYYLGKYDATGQARVEDWRVVEFVEGKTNG